MGRTRQNVTKTTTGTVADSESTVLAERKIAGIIARRGDDMELQFKKADPAGSGVIPVKAFSKCLRSWDIINNAEESMRENRLLLTQYDRKALYRKWAVHGQVKELQRRVGVRMFSCLFYIWPSEANRVMVYRSSGEAASGQVGLPYVVTTPPDPQLI